LRHEQTVLSPTKLGENAGSLFARRSADHSARYAAIGPLDPKARSPKLKLRSLVQTTQPRCNPH
jgi:hypothetical protein